MPREGRTGLAWNCGLAWWARWWDVVLGEAGVTQIRGQCSWTLLSCVFHRLRLGVVERERLMGDSLLRIYLRSRKNKGPGFQAVLGLRE